MRLQEHSHSTSLLAVNADLSKSTKIISDHIYSVLNNCQGIRVGLKEACSHADDGDI